MNAARVLVIDDDGDIRRLVAELLRRAGLTVEEAEDGRSGLRALHRTSPDLVVLDVSMPDLDGWETLERIRDLSEVPVLMLTARGDELETKDEGCLSLRGVLVPVERATTRASWLYPEPGVAPSYET